MLLNLWLCLAGNKTYILALAFTAYAAFGFSTGTLDANAALQIVMTAGIGGTIRHGLETRAHPGFGRHDDGCDHDGDHDDCDHDHPDAGEHS